jgi:hypothetical protein
LNEQVREPVVRRNIDEDLSTIAERRVESTVRPVADDGRVEDRDSGLSVEPAGAADDDRAVSLDGHGVRGFGSRRPQLRHQPAVSVERRIEPPVGRVAPDEDVHPVELTLVLPRSGDDDLPVGLQCEGVDRPRRTDVGHDFATLPEPRVERAVGVQPDERKIALERGLLLASPADDNDLAVRLDGDRRSGAIRRRAVVDEHLARAPE